METLKEKLFLIPKGSNGLRLHPRAFVDEHMKSYEKVTGILLSAEEVEKLQADKAELLEALEIFFPMFTELDSEFGIENPHPRKWTETEISTVQRLFELIQKHKQ